MKDFICTICGCQEGHVLNSYKHKWTTCRDCRNIFRKRKNIYPVPRIFPFLKQNHFKGKLKSIGTLWFPNEDVIHSEDAFYHYYSDAAQHENNGSWQGESEQIKKEFHSLGIEIAGKSILDISGGPGFFARDLKDIARDITVTEFSPVAAEGMKKSLSVDAVKYDYNTDRIEDIFRDRKFDIIFIRYSVNFCKNIGDFAVSLGKIINPDGIVYISYVAPSLGCCLWWQYDEYTYEILYEPETLLKKFSENGFKRIVHYNLHNYIPAEYYLRHTPMGYAMHVFRHVFICYYGLLSLFAGKDISRDKSQRIFVDVFRY